MPPMLLLFATMLACGEDPVLTAAREEAEASELPDEEASGTIRATRGHPMDGGVPSGSSPPQEGAPTAGRPEEPTPGIPDEPTPAAPGSPGGGTPADGAQGKGVPPQPQPGRAGEPTPGKPEEPAPGGRALFHDGPVVTLRGKVVYPGFEGGLLRVDIFDGDHLTMGGKRPSVVSMVTLDKPGPFEVQVPESTEYVWVSAFNDADLNERPGPLDPTGNYLGNPVPTDRGDQSGITVTLIRREAPQDGGIDDF